MKTRRAFLTGAGLGAGAAALGLPGAAQAWGGRRRRCYSPPSCEPACAPGCSCPSCASSVQASPLRPQFYTTQCSLACPQYLITQANGVYYYYCGCCFPASGGNMSIPNSTQLNPVNGFPVKCTGDSDDPTYCFRLGTGLAQSRSASNSTTPDSPDIPFLISSIMTDPNGNVTTNPVVPAGTLAQKIFNDGIVDVASMDALTDALLAGCVTSGATLIGPSFAGYNGPGSTARVIALYGLGWVSPAGASLWLHIGQEVPSTVLPATANVKKPDQVAYPDNGLQRYHRLTMNSSDNFYYHVVARKSQP
jgi:hypothetical protein